MPAYEPEHTERTITLTVGGVTLDGTLAVPTNPHGVILFAHGSGSSRFSPRNLHVAAVLRRAGLATLLLDLLSPAEERVDLVTRHLRFDIPLLAERLAGAIDWLGATPDFAMQPVGLFGASTGGGAALVAAAARPHRVGAVVSRGGRPDLAGAALTRVEAPTLLLVGALDGQVIELNERARAAMHAEVRLELIPGATHLFEEQGALELVAERARDWFLAHLHPLAVHGATAGETAPGETRSREGRPA